MATVCSLEPFRAEHLRDLTDQVIGDREMDIAMGAQHHPSWTARFNGRIVACAGLVVIGAGQGVAWMRLSAEVRKRPIWFYKITKKILEDQCRVWGLHRIEAKVLASSARDCRWIERMGFVYEGEARKAMPDKTNAFSYARVM